MLLGPARSIEELYRVRKDLERKLKGERPTPYWREMAVKWEWDARAQAYDQHLRQRDLANEEDRRLAARERRRRIVENQLDDASKAVANAGSPSDPAASIIGPPCLTMLTTMKAKIAETIARVASLITRGLRCMVEVPVLT
jgi:hypothetical protein